ncbi:hypothetical protein MA16_Dca001105 [Dendrobium catenatum]|uniref:Uncharacterized protein n=1 Tax=Dendrobium catenatum TaxID=906689 RepID=A0A2I0WLG8_9ASPA|nr:hypothetical protein MA16_Dca001105 [Dendrobium catenatum]
MYVNSRAHCFPSAYEVGGPSMACVVDPYNERPSSSYFTSVSATFKLSVLPRMPTSENSLTNTPHLVKLNGQYKHYGGLFLILLRHRIRIKVDKMMYVKAFMIVNLGEGARVHFNSSILRISVPNVKGIVKKTSIEAIDEKSPKRNSVFSRLSMSPVIAPVIQKKVPDTKI